MRSSEVYRNTPKSIGVPNENKVLFNDTFDRGLTQNEKFPDLFQ